MRWTRSDTQRISIWFVVTDNSKKHGQPQNKTFEKIKVRKTKTRQPLRGTIR